MDVLFQGFNGLWETLCCAIDFAKIEISEGFEGTQLAGVEKSGFGSRKIAQRDSGDTKEQERVVIVGMKLQLAFEFEACLRIGLFPPEFEHGVAEQFVGARIFWVELNGFAEFGSGGFREMAYGIRAPDENM